MPERPAEAPSKDAFHVERSRFLDAFAALEEALSTTKSSKPDKTLDDQINALRVIRNDLVHTQMKFIQFNGQLHAIAVNSANAADRARLARIVSLDDLSSLSKELAQLAGSCKAA